MLVILRYIEQKNMFQIDAAINGGNSGGALLNSNADKSELEIGNIITEIEGKKVTLVDVIKSALNSKNKGDKISLKIKYISRNEYKEKEIMIVLN